MKIRHYVQNTNTQSYERPLVPIKCNTLLLTIFQYIQANTAVLINQCICNVVDSQPRMVRFICRKTVHLPRKLIKIYDRILRSSYLTQSRSRLFGYWCHKTLFQGPINDNLIYRRVWPQIIDLEKYTTTHRTSVGIFRETFGNILQRLHFETSRNSQSKPRSNHFWDNNVTKRHTV